jgi:hypothetical protein
VSKTLGVILIVLGPLRSCVGWVYVYDQGKGRRHRTDSRYSRKDSQRSAALPSWARWRSLAALYFSWQAERNRFGGICFWNPLFLYIGIGLGHKTGDSGILTLPSRNVSLEWRAECDGDRHGATFTSLTIGKDIWPCGNHPRNR